MRPPWPRLAHRSLVRGVPAWPRCGLVWSRQEWPGVVKPLIWLHLVAFGCFPHPPNPHPALSQRERGLCLRGNDEGFRGNDACRQCRGWRGDGAMGSCRWIGVEGGASLFCHRPQRFGDLVDELTGLGQPLASQSPKSASCLSIRSDALKSSGDLATASSTFADGRLAGHCVPPRLR